MVVEVGNARSYLDVAATCRFFRALSVESIKMYPGLVYFGLVDAEIGFSYRRGSLSPTTAESDPSRACRDAWTSCPWA